MLSVGTMHFENRFCASKMVIGGGGHAYSRHAVHMMAVLADCTKALISTDWAISFLYDISRHRTAPLLFCRVSISDNVGSFQSVEAFGDWRPLTIVSMLMSGFD